MASEVNSLWVRVKRCLFQANNLDMLSLCRVCGIVMDGGLESRVVGN